MKNANSRSNRIESQSEGVEGASGIDVKAEKEKEESNEARTTTSSQDDGGDNENYLTDNVCPKGKDSLLELGHKNTADGGSGAAVEEDGRNREESGVEVVENMTSLADTVNNLQNTTGAEPTVVLRC